MSASRSLSSLEDFGRGHRKGSFGKARVLSFNSQKKNNNFSYTTCILCLLSIFSNCILCMFLVSDQNKEEKRYIFLREMRILRDRTPETSDEEV